MANDGSMRNNAETSTPLRRALRSFTEAAPEDGESSGTNTPGQVRQTSYAPASRHGTLYGPTSNHDLPLRSYLLAYPQQPATIFASPTHSPRPEATDSSSNTYQSSIQTYFAFPGASPNRASSSRGRAYRPSSAPRGRRRLSRHSTFAQSLYNPTFQIQQGEGVGEGSGDSYEQDLALALQLDLLDDASDTFEDPGIYYQESDSRLHSEHIHFADYDWDDQVDSGLVAAPTHSRANSSPASSLHHHINSLRRTMPGPSKRSRDSYEGVDERNITRVLNFRGAVTAMLYNSSSPNPEANDIWPECRSSAKLPARYYLLDPSHQPASDPVPKHRQSKKNGKKAVITKQNEKPQESHGSLPDPPIGRPEWNLPVELVELIAEHLNRDDIKALRLVSRELNHYVSQVIFQTVVVPFNTEIYGMLGQEPKPDFKGKKRARIEQPSYSWKNANGDEVYNGHGLDVFRGFGKHIRKFGMSFEVNEDSLAMPPVKSLTEKKTSFWGNYDWPYEEYRRFDAVAGLETAADETPRMKTAFSKLAKVKELALSIDSGLGWLNGPDRSIRARVLHRPSRVFGTAKAIPDRRAQAQQELWKYIEACHENADSDVKLATLYRMDGQLFVSELKEVDNNLADQQPQTPYLDPQLIQAATPYDTGDMPVPTSFDDPYVLDRFVSTPSPSGTGILFSSTKTPSEGAQLVNPVIPANLTKAQKEWLLETEWAQRAFMSSYMLSIIDNPTTFKEVHMLNISGLSDRYLPMLNRSDFWDALPKLHHVTIMLIPGWRSVQKDEVGFVDTPKVNPTHSTGVLFDLLRDQVAYRANIRHLKVGFVTGGEHAEGLYARNKLLFPAPVMNMRVREDDPSVYATALVATDAAHLRKCLLELPHVEQLVLNNCWITPAALLEFVKMHDKHKLQTLVLDSVSLTGILRPNPNPHQQAAVFNNVMPAQLGVGALFGAVGAQGPQFVQNQQQFLQAYIHTLQIQLQQLQAHAGALQNNNIAALQNQLQQQIGQMPNGPGQQPHNQAQGQVQGQGQAQVQAPVPAQAQAQPTQQVQAIAQQHINFANVAQLATQVHQLHTQMALGQQPQPVPALANVQAVGDTRSLLKIQHREGSWVDIIDQISPGTNLSDFESDHSKADSNRITSLRTIEFISCGYAKLSNTSFDQADVDPLGMASHWRNQMLSKRIAALAPAMQSSKWTHLGDIVQDFDPSELAALDAGWNLRTGWEDTEAARAVEFDGLLAGGTGRFTGSIRHSDRVADEASAS
jgi:hypothetical protein